MSAIDKMSEIMNQIVTYEKEYTKISEDSEFKIEKLAIRRMQESLLNNIHLLINEYHSKQN